MEKLYLPGMIIHQRFAQLKYTILRSYQALWDEQHQNINRKKIIKPHEEMKYH